VNSPEPGAWLAKHAAKALLGYVLDGLLTGAPPGEQETAVVPGPWDAWWACYRAGLPLPATGIQVRAGGTMCPACAGRAGALAAADPPGHPGTEPGPCGCLLRWAAVLRSPGPPAGWPPVMLSLALIKPGAPAGQVQGLLAPWFEVLSARELTLTTADTRRLYPEAYGGSYVAERDAYMTSGPVRVLVLRARHPAVSGRNVKAAIRDRIGGDTLRNHLHMPDNPGEALADIAHFAGYGELAALHRRYERDHAASRLAFYRAALGIGEPGTHRLPAAG
jgi:hypothetical protein